MRQQLRVLTALGYIAVLIVFNIVIFGDVFPAIGARGAWFYSGLVLVLLSVALSEPFYASPATSLSSAVTVILLAAAFPVAAGSPNGAAQETIMGTKLGFMIGGALLSVNALVAIFLKDEGGWRGRLANWTTDRAAEIGTGRVIFSAVFLASAYAVYSDDSVRLAQLALLWLAIVVVAPLEYFISKAQSPRRRSVGEVRGLRNPGLVELRLAPDLIVQPGDVVDFARSGGTGLVLDTSQTGTGVWALVAASGTQLPRFGERATVRSRSEDEMATAVLGPVEPGTSISDIAFRVPSSTPLLREGNLISVEVRGEPVLYQAVRALIRGETTDVGVAHRYVEVTARKIGRWNAQNATFERVSWLPAAGTQVHLQTVETAEAKSECIGVVPDSSYGISLRAHELVTHNTAVLGILGVGKTYLTFELIRRVLAEGIKVVVIDITGEYKIEFSEVLPEGEPDGLVKRVSGAISENKMTVSKHVHEGGNVNDFKFAVADELADFLNSNAPLLVLDPSRFDVMRQDSKPYQDEASMAPLTLVETSQIIVEQLLNLVSTEITKKAKMCLVLEEAHSIVPEWNSTSYEGDRQASNGIAKAVLQGRKYGLGVVLVTQRTANVAKTVLNQCNTIFALRTFDATGMDFLKNYIGETYSDVLSGLEERTAVVFGRASSCASPVIVRLNDRDAMLEAFWEEVKEPLIEKANPKPTDSADGASPDEPFQGAF